MNPVDHPLGGGQGKTSGGRPSCNFLGRNVKGVKTKRIRQSGKVYLKR
jgi:large subunit ribosomal protein L2